MDEDTALPSKLRSSSALQSQFTNDATSKACDFVGSLEKQVQDVSSSTAKIHDIEKMYEEREQYLFSEIARYATEYQRLQDERDMHEEKEDYLLSEIAHMVSDGPSLEAEVERHKEMAAQLKARVTELERSIEETQEDLRLAVEDRTKAEKDLTHLMVGKSATEKRLIQLKEKLEENALMFSQPFHEYEKDDNELNVKMCYLVQNYEAIVCERDALRDHLHALLNKPNGNTPQEHIHEKIDGLLEEKEELEELLTSLIEQKTFIQNYADEHIASMEEEKTRLIRECNKQKERNDKLRVEYEGVIRESDFLKAYVDFLSKELRKKLTTLKEKKGQLIDVDEHISVAVAFLVFAFFISIHGGNCVVALMLLFAILLILIRLRSTY